MSFQLHQFACWYFQVFYLSLHTISPLNPSTFCDFVDLRFWPYKATFCEFFGLSEHKCAIFFCSSRCSLTIEFISCFVSYFCGLDIGQMMGQVNRERLAEYLGELQRKEDTNDRYVAALEGKTLTRKPYVRIQPIPNQSNDATVKEQQIKKENK